MTCYRCGGWLYRDLYRELTCLMCGRVANPVIPLDIPKEEKDNGHYGPRVGGRFARKQGAKAS